MPPDSPQAYAFQQLIQRGYSPVHAAALVGNMMQESSMNPRDVNAKEDAHGLLQWRLDRWRGLQDFAKARGTDPTDMGTQLDYIRQEMNGPESKAGQRFLATNDLPSANSALKQFIRYGDNSDATRLKYASGLLGDQAGAAAPAGGPAVPPSAMPGVAAPPPTAAPGAAPGILNGGQPQQGGPDIAAVVKSLQQIMQPQQQAPIPQLPPINFPQPPGLSRALLRAALAPSLGAPGQGQG